MHERASTLAANVIPPVIVWETKPEGLVIYSDGVRVGVVPENQLPALMLSIARALKGEV